MKKNANRLRALKLAPAMVRHKERPAAKDCGKKLTRLSGQPLLYRVLLQRAKAGQPK